MSAIFWRTPTRNISDYFPLFFLILLISRLFFFFFFFFLSLFGMLGGDICSECAKLIELASVVFIVLRDENEISHDKVVRHSRSHALSSCVCFFFFSKNQSLKFKFQHFSSMSSCSAPVLRVVCFSSPDVVTQTF